MDYNDIQNKPNRQQSVNSLRDKNNQPTRRGIDYNDNGGEDDFWSGGVADYGKYLGARGRSQPDSPTILWLPSTLTEGITKDDTLKS